MLMDLIGGIVIITSVFMLAVAIVSHRLAGAPWSNDDLKHRLIEQALQRRTRTAFITLLIGLVLGLVDVFVTAQLPEMAFVNLVIGAATIGIVYSAASRGFGAEEGEWRR
jgi:hypothetical protein